LNRAGSRPNVTLVTNVYYNTSATVIRTISIPYLVKRNYESQVALR
jgi:hypothetical protein